MVVSRCPHRFFLAAFTKRSTSVSDRYSRVRSLLFGGRLGAAVRFTVAGVTSLRCDFCIRCAAPGNETVLIMIILRTVVNLAHQGAGCSSRGDGVDASQEKIRQG